MKRIILYILFFSSFYFSSIHFTDYHHIAITWNPLSGETKLDTIAGYNITPPWVLVSRIDTRPHKVCISSSTRNFNCLLVEFNSKYWKEFLELEGFKYYWWSNRMSFNMGYDEEYRGMKDILRGYAYDTEPHRFIRITKTYN